MKSRIILFLGAFFTLLLCSAKEYTVILPAVPGPEQIFFLDLAGTGADSSTFQVTTPDGKQVRFSFDMRITRQEIKGKFLRAVDGFYSKESAPAAERRFERPGFLSFKTVPGVKEYIFKFKDGAKVIQSRPDPAVRGWWIEIMRDPFLKDIRNISCYKGRFKMRQGGGVEFTYPIRIWRKAANIDKRIDGRRIFALLRGTGPFEYFSIPLKNGVWDKTSAIACYIKPAKGVMMDHCSEGLLAAKDAHLAQNHRNYGRFILNTEYVKGTAFIKEIHLQLPPVNRNMGISLDSDLFNTGDILHIKPYGGIGESAVPFESGSIKGLRYGIWKGKTDIFYELTDAKGKRLLKGKGNKIFLRNIKEGSFTLHVRLELDGHFAMKKSFPIRVQPSPF